MARHAYAALVAVQVFYGMLPAAGKTVFLDLHPVQMTALRVLGAAVILIAWHLARGGQWPEARLWPGVARLALFGIVVNMGLFAIGLQWTHPVNATLIITTIPVITYLMAVFMGRETLGPRRLLGILLALSGAVYLIGLSGFETSGKSALGDLFVLINAFSFSYFLVISKPWAEEHGVMRLNVWMFAAAAMLFLPVALWLDAPADLLVASTATQRWMVFIVAAPTVGAYVLNATALRAVSSSTVAAFIYLQPPISALASWVVLDTLPDWRIIPAAVLILAGVTIVARRQAKREEEKKEAAAA